jgi:hypothetical protein
MTTDPLRSDFDDDERQFVTDAGLAAEASWRACPSLSLLLAADEGVLPPDTQEQVAGHVAGCAFCRSLVQDVKEAGLGVPTEEDHERIQARVRSEVPAAQVRSSQVRTAQRFSGGVQGLALAASLVLVVTLGWYAWSLQQRAGTLEQTVGTLRDSGSQDQRRTAVLEGQLAALRAQVEQPGGEPNVPVVDLEPLGARRNSEATRSFGVPRNARFVTVILQVDGAGNAGNADGLTVDIRTASGESRFSLDGLRASSAGVVTLLVPRGAMPDGEAAISLVRTRDGRRVTVGEYRARFDPIGGPR